MDTRLAVSYCRYQLPGMFQQQRVFGKPDSGCHETFCGGLLTNDKDCTREESSFEDTEEGTKHCQDFPVVNKAHF